MEEYIIHNAHPLDVSIKRMPLSYYVTTPKKIDKNTIPIVVLHGFGHYANNEYMKSLHNTLTTNYNVSIISVNYVGTFDKFRFIRTKKPINCLNQKIEIISETIKEHFLKLLNSILTNPSNMSQVLIQNNYLYDNINLIHFTRSIKLLIHYIKSNLCDGYYILDRLYEMGFKRSPIEFSFETVGDHQDFGSIQAIDVLTAIADIKTKYTNLNWSKLSLAGTSHGAYIASICDKYAPNTFHTIVNNSSWLYCDEKELITSSMEVDLSGLKFIIHSNQYWDNYNNKFQQHHKEIRDLTNIQHIKEQKKQTFNISNKRYVFSHTINDHLINIEDKDKYIQQLQEEDFNLNYIRLDDESKLDGKTFKSLEHAATASLKGLVIDFVVNNSNDLEIKTDDFELKSIIQYSCIDGTYTIDYSSTYPKLSFKPHK